MRNIYSLIKRLFKYPIKLTKCANQLHSYLLCCRKSILSFLPPFASFELFVWADAADPLLSGFIFSVCSFQSVSAPVLCCSAIRKYTPEPMSTFTWETKWTHTDLRFQAGMETSSVHMKFHFGSISKRPDILMDMCRHFFSGGAYIIFHHPKWNFILVKMTDMKSIPSLSFNHTCALIATSNESALIHFVSGKLCSHENLMPVWNFISVKMTDMKSIPFWVSFRLNSCEHK